MLLESWLDLYMLWYVHAMPSEAISTAYIINPSTNNINTAASQTFEVNTVILLECLYQLLVLITCHTKHLNGALHDIVVQHPAAGYCLRVFLKTILHAAHLVRSHLKSFKLYVTIHFEQIGHPDRQQLPCKSRILDI